MKTIKIHGKDYVPVHERLKWLKANEDYDLVSKIKFLPEQNAWLVKATLTVYIGENWIPRTYTGHAVEVIGSSMINKQSALENCETSAWGRALAAYGIGIDGGIASADEMLEVLDPKIQIRNKNYSHAKK